MSSLSLRTQQATQISTSAKLITRSPTSPASSQALSVRRYGLHFTSSLRTLSPDAEQYVPFLAPNTSAVSAGGQGVFVASSLNTSLTASSAPAPVNLTALGQQVPAAGYPNGSTSAPGPASSSNSSTTSGAGRTARDLVFPRMVVVALVAVAIASAYEVVV